MDSSFIGDSQITPSKHDSCFVKVLEVVFPMSGVAFVLISSLPIADEIVLLACFLVFWAARLDFGDIMLV